MITLHKLPKTAKRTKKRKGQGGGSGKGKTAGRGTKGQRARGKIPARLGLTGSSFIKRLPLFRGKYRNKPKKNKPLVINLKDLSSFAPQTVVNLETLVKYHIIKADDAYKYGVKILGSGEIEIPLTVNLPCSKGAIKKIEKAKGSVEKVSDRK